MPLEFLSSLKTGSFQIGNFVEKIGLWVGTRFANAGCYGTMEKSMSRIFLIALVFFLFTNSVCFCQAQTICDQDRIREYASSVDSLRISGAFAQAYDVAKSLRSARLACAESLPYELTEDGRLVELLEFVAKLPPESQIELAWADSVEAQVRDFSARGSFSEDLALAEQLVDIRSRHLGPRDPSTLLGRCFVAGIYNAMGEYGEAEVRYRAALEVYRSVVEVDNPIIAWCASRIARVLKNQGQFEAAEPFYREALDIAIAAYGNSHFEVSPYHNDLAVFLKRSGRYAASEKHYLESLQIRQGAAEKPSSSLATTLNNIASLYKSMGNFELAEHYYLEAISMWKDIDEQNHRHYYTTLNNYGGLLVQMGQMAKAEV